MSEIIIRGMKFPSGCAECDFNNDGICKRMPYKGFDESNGSTRRHGCPLVELPPHGRLIDVDKVLHPDPSTTSMPHAVTAMKLIEAPTVIPSNKEAQ